MVVFQWIKLLLAISASLHYGGTGAVVAFGTAPYVARL